MTTTTGATWEATSCRQGRLDIRRYFRGFARPNLPRMDKREFSERGWAKTPIEWVQLSKLYATQRWISKSGLKHHDRPGARSDGGYAPFVVHHEGRYYLFDGHHRVVTAIDRGETRIRAHVKRIGLGNIGKKGSVVS